MKTDGEGSVPTIFCPNSQCGRAYHASCLTLWFRANPSSHTSFGSLFGPCVFCGHQLSVPTT